MGKDKLPPKIWYECPVCNDWFDTEAKCQKHMKVHDNEKELWLVVLDWVDGRWVLRVRNMRRVPKSAHVDNKVIRGSSNFWYVETEYGDAKGIRNAKKRLKAAALRWMRRQVALVEKLNVDEEL